MQAFFLKVIEFFRNVISTLRNKGKSLNVRVEIDSNHDGKSDISMEVNSEGLAVRTDKTKARGLDTDEK